MIKHPKYGNLYTLKEVAELAMCTYYTITRKPPEDRPKNTTIFGKTFYREKDVFEWLDLEVAKNSRRKIDLSINRGR